MDDEFFNWEDPCYGMSEPPKQETKTDKRCINRIIKDEWKANDYCIIKEQPTQQGEQDELNSFWNDSLNLLGNENK